MDIERDVLAEIGRVVVEATNLEWALAFLVGSRWGWDGRYETQLTSKNGLVRRHLSMLVALDPEWDGIRRLEQQVCALLEERNRLPFGSRACV